MICRMGQFEHVWYYGGISFKLRVYKFTVALQVTDHWVGNRNGCFAVDCRGPVVTCHMVL